MIEVWHRVKEVWVQPTFPDFWIFRLRFQFAGSKLRVLWWHLKNGSFWKPCRTCNYPIYLLTDVDYWILVVPLDSQKSFTMLLGRKAGFFSVTPPVFSHFNFAAKEATRMLKTLTIRLASYWWISSRVLHSSVGPADGSGPDYRSFRMIRWKRGQLVQLLYHVWCLYIMLSKSYLPRIGDWNRPVCFFFYI